MARGFHGSLPMLGAAGGAGKALAVSVDRDIFGNSTLRCVDLDTGGSVEVEPSGFSPLVDPTSGTAGEILRLVLANRVLENRGAHGISLRANVKPYTYQLRPLLKFNSSAGRRMLIADETGLGKTIEAGMIIAEMIAELGPECRVMVWSPAGVSTKWVMELRKKFGIRSQTKRLQQVVDNLDRSRSWSRKLGTQVCVVSHDSMREDTAVDVPAGSIDLLVIDEIHNFIGRGANGTKRRSRALDLTAGSDACLGLSATPVMLEREDLQRILSVVAPGEHEEADFPQQAVTQVSVNRFMSSLQGTDDPVVDDVLRDNWPPGADIELDALLTEPSVVNRVIASKVARTIGPIGRRITRARGRDPDVDQWMKRKVTDHLVPMGQHRDLIERTDTYMQEHRSFANRQQLASCPSGILPVLEEDVGGPVAQAEAAELSHLLSVHMPNTGPKVEALVDLLKELQTRDDITKVVVFTHWIPTLTHLPAILRAEGLPVLALNPAKSGGRFRDRWGEPSEVETLVSRFRGTDGFAVLVGSDRMSEGIDLEMANVVINMDLPFNPAKIQQRIGRLDRPIIQDSEFLEVHNLVLEGSIEERVIDVLRTRVVAFYDMIGGMEDIVESDEDEPVTDEAARKVVGKLSKRLDMRELAMSDNVLRVVDGALDGDISKRRKRLHPIHALGHLVVSNAMSGLGISSQLNQDETEISLDGGDEVWRVIESRGNGFLPWEIDEVRDLIEGRATDCVMISVVGGSTSIGPMHPFVHSCENLLISKEGFQTAPLPTAPSQSRLLVGSSTGADRWSIVEEDGSSSGVESAELIEMLQTGGSTTGTWHEHADDDGMKVWTHLRG